MTSKNDTGHYQGVLLEDINHKFDVIVEYLAPLAKLPRKVDQIDERLQRVESDVKVIKRVVTDQGKDHKQLEGRVATLER